MCQPILTISNKRKVSCASSYSRRKQLSWDHNGWKTKRIKEMSWKSNELIKLEDLWKELFGRQQKVVFLILRGDRVSIWQAIRAKGGNQILLLWNAYLYHPFEKSGKDSNRKPNAAKLQVRRSTWRNCSVFLEFLKIVFMQWEEQQKNRWDI